MEESSGAEVLRCAKTSGASLFGERALVWFLGVEFRMII